MSYIKLNQCRCGSNTVMLSTLFQEDTQSVGEVRCIKCGQKCQTPYAWNKENPATLWKPDMSQVVVKHRQQGDCQAVANEGLCTGKDCCDCILYEENFEEYKKWRVE